LKQRNKWTALVTRVLRLVMLGLCGLVLGVNIYMANSRKLLGEQLPMPFGYGVAVVLSGSMEPELYKDDLIIVEKCESFAVRDVVVFQDGGNLVVHRILELDGETAVTKGDNNPDDDGTIALNAIKGKVIAKVPAVGAVVNWLKTPVGIILTLAAAIALVEIPRRNEKKKNDDQRQALIDEINRLKEQ